MTITTDVNKFRYEGNGVTDTFAFNGRIFNASDLVVEIITRATDALVETLTITTDYTVTINSDESASVVVAGAKIPSNLQDIQIRRALAQTQTLNLPTGTVFPAISVENALDKVTALTQDVSEILDRTVTLSVTSSANAPTIGSLTTSEVVVYDGTSLITNGLSTTNLTTLASITGDITTVAGISASITAVAADATDIGIVATNIADINTTADNIASIITAAGLVTGFLGSNNTWAGTNDFEGAVTFDAPTLGGNMSGASTHKLVNMADGTSPQDYVTKAQLDGIQSGGWVPIQTQTVTTAVASVDFTSGIDGTYKAYVIVWSLVKPSVDDGVPSFRVGNGGSFDSGASDYAYAGKNYDTMDNDVGVRSTGASQIAFTQGTGNAANEFNSGTLIIFNPSEAEYTYMYGSGSNFGSARPLSYFHFTGVRQEAAAHDRIQFLFSSGDITAGTFTLYGLAGA